MTLQYNLRPKNKPAKTVSDTQTAIIVAPRPVGDVIRERDAFAASQCIFFTTWEWGKRR